MYLFDSTQDILEKYKQEEFRILPGLYSDFDLRVCYSLVREFKPTNIVELGTREGKTTSGISAALFKNSLNAQYTSFERDEKFFGITSCFLVEYPTIKYSLRKNIIDEYSDLSDIDLLFIDGNHDYILARWYIKNLFPKLKRPSLIHIHDMYYNESGNGWNDILFKGHDHPDIINIDRLKELYGDYYSDFCDKSFSITRYEGDEIYDWYQKNNPPFLSTLELSKNIGITTPFPPCSLWFYLGN